MLLVCDNVDKNAKKTFLWALFGGCAVHQFGLVNVLHNIDDIGQFPYGYGTGITSGRWFLTILGDCLQCLGGNYNLPYVNGLLYLVLIAIAAALTVSVLKIHTPLYSILVGLLFAVFPSATSALFFRFTSIYYGISFVFSILAVWILKNNKFGFFFSILLIACSLGIYQGYVPVTISLFVLLLIQEALQGNSGLSQLVKNGFYYCFVLIAGLAMYILLLNISLNVYDYVLSDYNGINQMGNISIKELPGLVYEALYYFCMMPIKGYCGLANTGIIKAIYLLLAVFSVSTIAYVIINKIHSLLVVAFSVLMCLLFPIAVNFVVIMSPNAWIYTMMLYAFVLIPCVPMVLFECLPEKIEEKYKNIAVTSLTRLVSVLIAGYAYSANVNYTAVYFSNRQVENYVSSLVTQIRMTEDFDENKKWMFLGEPEDTLLRSAFDYEMSYGGAFSTERTLQNYSRAPWIWHYVGYLPPTASQDEAERIAKLDEVRQMPCWPAEGSIIVKEEYVVVKFQETLG